MSYRPLSHLAVTLATVAALSGTAAWAASGTTDATAANPTPAIAYMVEVQHGSNDVKYWDITQFHLVEPARRPGFAPEDPFGGGQVRMTMPMQVAQTLANDLATGTVPASAPTNSLWYAWNNQGGEGTVKVSFWVATTADTTPILAAPTFTVTFTGCHPLSWTFDVQSPLQAPLTAIPGQLDVDNLPAQLGSDTFETLAFDYRKATPSGNGAPWSYLLALIR